mgnify:CR=1 FL=1
MFHPAPLTFIAGFISENPTDTGCMEFLARLEHCPSGGLPSCAATQGGDSKCALF